MICSASLLDYEATSWIQQLHQDTTHAQQSAYATGTINNLRSHLRSYFMFCVATGHSPLVFSAQHICHYLVFLSRTASYSTLKNHLSSIGLLFQLHNMHIDLHQDFFIRLTLRGLKRIHGHSPSTKLPITPQILLRLRSTINFQQSLDLVFWTAALVAFFTFFRKSNSFVSSSTAFDPARNLTRNDVQILQSFALITVTWTKTIQNKERLLSIPIPRIPNSPLCPVSALEHYFLQVPVSISPCLPFFTFVQGNQLHPLTYSLFVKLLRTKLSALGLQPELYSSHSFRRGGASFAFALHLPGELIQLQGDWKSDAYLHYLDKPLTQRLKVAFAFRNALARS